MRRGKIEEQSSPTYLTGSLLMLRPGIRNVALPDKNPQNVSNSSEDSVNERVKRRHLRQSYHFEQPVFRNGDVICRMKPCAEHQSRIEQFLRVFRQNAKVLVSY